MAEGYKSSLIASLRGSAPAAPTVAAAPTALNYEWMNSGAPVEFRRRVVGGALNPQRITIPKAPSIDRQTFLAREFAKQADKWTPTSGQVNPVAALINANKDRVEYVETANPVLNYAQQDPTFSVGMPTASIGRDEYGDKFGLNVGDFSNLPVVEIPNLYAESLPYEFDFGDVNGGVPSDGVQVVAQKPAPAPAPATAPVTDEVSVRQTLEQILADPAPQVIEQPAAEPMPDLNIPAFDSGINFQMPTELFRTPAPFVSGFTPDADVYAAMQAPIPAAPQPQAAAPATSTGDFTEPSVGKSLEELLAAEEAPVPATTPVPEPEYIDPGLLAMLGVEAEEPAPATQPLIEEPIYGLPWWYLDGLNGDWEIR